MGKTLISVVLVRLEISTVSLTKLCLLGIVFERKRFVK